MLCLSGFELYSRWVLLMSKRAVSSFKFPQGPIYFKPLCGGGGLFTFSEDDDTNAP